MRRLFSEPPHALSTRMVIADPESSDADDDPPKGEADTETLDSIDSEGATYTTVTDPDSYAGTTIQNGQASSLRWGWMPEDNASEATHEMQFNEEFVHQQVMQQQWHLAFYQGIPVAPFHPTIIACPALGTVMADPRLANVSTLVQAEPLPSHSQGLESADAKATEAAEDMDMTLSAGAPKQVGLQCTFSVGPGAYGIAARCRTAVIEFSEPRPSPHLASPHELEICSGILQDLPMTRPSWTTDAWLPTRRVMGAGSASFSRVGS